MEKAEVVLPCADKLVFDSKNQAQASVATIKWQRGTKLRAYQCRHCELWHMASA